MLNFPFVFMLWNILFAIICWHERHCDVLRGMHSSLITFCLTFRSVWLWLIAFAPMTCLNDVFLKKAMIGVALKKFPNVLLIFNISQCLLIISLIFVTCYLLFDIWSKVWLYVTENGTKFFCTALVLFNRVYLSRWCFLCTHFPRIV